MRSLPSASAVRPRPVHPYEWLWEPLADDPSFVLKPMFGGRSVHLDGRLVLHFAAKDEPWRGLFICTERSHHASLLSEFPMLVAHTVLPKWLYLSESAASFERTAAHLVQLARRRDPRFGILPADTRRKKPARARRYTLRRPDDHP